MPVVTTSSTHRNSEQIDAKKKLRRFRSGLFAALIGASGFGMQLDRTIVDYRRPSGGSRVVGDIMLGLIFLALAVQNSIRLLRQKSEDRH